MPSLHPQIVAAGSYPQRVAGIYNIGGGRRFSVPG
jgi:hypothetical protein